MVMAVKIVRQPAHNPILISTDHHCCSSSLVQFKLRRYCADVRPITIPSGQKRSPINGVRSNFSGHISLSTDLRNQQISFKFPALGWRSAFFTGCQHRSGQCIISQHISSQHPGAQQVSCSGRNTLANSLDMSNRCQRS